MRSSLFEELPPEWVGIIALVLTAIVVLASRLKRHERHAQEWDLAARDRLERALALGQLADVTRWRPLYRSSRSRHPVRCLEVRLPLLPKELVMAPDDWLGNLDGWLADPTFQVGSVLDQRFRFQADDVDRARALFRQPQVESALEALSNGGGIPYIENGRLGLAPGTSSMSSPIAVQIEDLLAAGQVLRTALEEGRAQQVG